MLSFILILDAFNCRDCRYVSHGFIYKILFVLFPLCDNFFSWTVNMSSFPLSVPTYMILLFINNVSNQDGACSLNKYCHSCMR